MGIRGGIDLGGTKIQAVVVDDGGDVLGSSRMPTPTTGGPPDVAETMAEAIRDAAKQADADTGDLEGVGVDNDKPPRRQDAKEPMQFMNRSIL